MTPARIWNVVVFPAPSGPIRPKISPRLMSRSTPRTAWVSPYVFAKRTTRIAAVLGDTSEVTDERVAVVVIGVPVASAKCRR